MLLLMLTNNIQTQSSDKANAVSRTTAGKSGATHDIVNQCLCRQHAAYHKQ